MHKALRSSPTTGEKDKKTLPFTVAAKTVFQPRCVAGIVQSIAYYTLYYLMELNSYYSITSRV